LIVRVVSFEWREKNANPRWRTTWMWANTVGSTGAALIWGIALSNLVHGVPLNSSHGYAGDFFDLFSAYTVLGGIAVVLLFAFHGANYLAIRTLDDLCIRAAAAARRLSVPAVLAAIGFVVWTAAVAHDRNSRGILPTAIPAAVTAAALLLGGAFTYARRSGWGFSMTGVAAIGVVMTIFTGLYPRVLVSHPNFANSLTTANAASGHYTLKIITIVAVIFVPIILIYQGWTYHVFRKRIGGEPVGAPAATVGIGTGGPAPD
jgi:cytochrome d ubiquinol oxidase subunit II